MFNQQNLAVFLISCRDRRGIVASISAFFFERGFNIVNCQQHTDPVESRFFMRILIDIGANPYARGQLTDEFQEVARSFVMEWSVHFTADTTRVAILASKEPHCLFDLLCRAHMGDLAGAQIALVISNHPHLESTAAQFRVPFFFCPVKPESRRAQEREISRLLSQHHIQLAVLARYMQIISSEMLDESQVPIINIHHAFLPAFQGAGPYRRAWDRGVKMIGATAHYVTAALDEGPIIEQDVERVTHEDSAEALEKTGRDIERIVLARAVQAHLEHRVITHANRTMVFSRGLPPAPGFSQVR